MSKQPPIPIGVDDYKRLVDDGSVYIDKTLLIKEFWEDGAPAQSSTKEQYAAITFYPDGSCESAQITLASRAPEEEQKMVIHLAGVTGAISHNLLVSTNVLPAPATEELSAADGSDAL